MFLGKTPLLLLALCLVLTAFPASADELAFETGPLMRATIYHDRSWGAADTAADGAFSSVNRGWEETRQGKWYIEQQRSGDQIIATGLAYNDRMLIDRGLRILEWGFARQNDDGSFSCDDAFHSTSFFIEAAAHAVLLLRAAPAGTEFAGRAEALRRKLGPTAHWMIRPDIEAAAAKNNEVFTHRRFLVGAALGEAGIALADEALLEKSRTYIRDGLRLQQPDGVNPEKHGHDSNYQAVGLMFALRYFRLVADQSLQREMQAPLAKAVAWQRSRITPQGDILTDGNTRSDDQERNRDGTAKGVNYSWTVTVLADWSDLAGDAGAAEEAERVWRRWQQVKPGKSGK